MEIWLWWSVEFISFIADICMRYLTWGANFYLYFFCFTSFLVGNLLIVISLPFMSKSLVLLPVPLSIIIHQQHYLIIHLDRYSSYVLEVYLKRAFFMVDYKFIRVIFLNQKLTNCTKPAKPNWITINLTKTKSNQPVVC